MGARGGGALSEAEIARRLPVWVALPELFLDTELQPSDHEVIARTLKESGYSLDELDAILFDEVTPAFGGNLLSVAGEWAGWPEEAVRDAVLPCVPASARPSIARWVRHRVFRAMIRDHWSSILACMAADPV
jgi:hypothetical protein